LINKYATCKAGTHTGESAHVKFNFLEKGQSTPAFGLPAATKLRQNLWFFLFQKPSRRLHVPERQIGATMGVSCLQGWVMQPSNGDVQLEIANGGIS
jgi:hypothetical protein